MIRILTTLILLATVMLWSGCGTTPKKVAYKTLAAVGASVQAASNALVDARVAGKVTDAQWEHARNVHNDFLQTYVFVCSNAAQDSFAPVDVIRMETEFLTLVNSILK